MATTTPYDQRSGEWDLLTTALNRYGVRHVAPGARVKGPVPAGEELFVRLAESSSVRLQEAIVILMLTHPDLGEAARRAIARLRGDARIRAMHRYVAACALQRMWWTRLASDLGPRPAIQQAYFDELGLPPLDEDLGRATLVALTNREERAYGYDAWAGYASLMDLFLAELIDPRWGQRHARVR
ncbi:MAG: hypothetical protein ACRDIY_20400 [Chloroflexota bacterium]